LPRVAQQLRGGGDTARPCSTNQAPPPSATARAHPPSAPPSGAQPQRRAGRDSGAASGGEHARASHSARGSCRPRRGGRAYAARAHGRARVALQCDAGGLEQADARQSARADAARHTGREPDAALAGSWPEGLRAAERARRIDGWRCALAQEIELLAAAAGADTGGELRPARDAQRPAPGARASAARHGGAAGTRRVPSGPLSPSSPATASFRDEPNSVRGRRINARVSHFRLPPKTPAVRPAKRALPWQQTRSFPSK